MPGRTFYAASVSQRVSPKPQPEFLRKRARELEAILRGLSDVQARAVVERQIADCNQRADDLESGDLESHDGESKGKR
jgi:hypothetical protein